MILRGYTFMTWGSYVGSHNRVGFSHPTRHFTTGLRMVFSPRP